MTMGRKVEQQTKKPQYFPFKTCKNFLSQCYKEIQRKKREKEREREREREREP